MNNILFGLIGFLMLGISGIGFAEVKTQLHVERMSPAAQEDDANSEDGNVAAGAAAEVSSSARMSASEAGEDTAPDTVPEVLSDVAARVEMALFDTWDDEGEYEDEDEDENEDDEGERRSKTAASAAGSANTNTAANVGTNTSAGVATFTLAQVAQHGTASSCYSAIGGSVYDLTPFVTKHPGGQSAIKSLCGVDGTVAFNSQHGGQAKPESVLAQYKIGVVAK